MDRKEVIVQTCTAGLCTGALRYRDMTAVRSLGSPKFFGYGSQPCSHVLDAGGPLDAPEWMPAGSVTNLEGVTGSGRSVVTLTESRRTA